MNCSLGCCSEGRTFVPDRGAINAPLLFIGENPGAAEVERMAPFVGPAGRKLMEFIAAAQIDLKDCYFTNTVHCKEDGRRPATPLPHELDACRPVLFETILRVKPKVVVCLGNTALSYFYPGFKVGKIHGTFRQWSVPVEDSQLEGSTISVSLVPTYHPSAVLHGNKEIIPIIIEDLVKARMLL